MALADARTGSEREHTAVQPTLAAAASTPNAAAKPVLLEDAVAVTPRSLLTARAFFVSWHGVLTLAYSGFPPALVDLKARLAAAHPALPLENPGSQWPKTSLGCLRNGMTLTPKQLEALLRICSEESSASFGGCDECAGSGQQQRQPLSILVDRLALITYSCRCLERLVSLQQLPLAPLLDASAPPAEEQARVSAILAEPQAADYFSSVARDGSREGHYRCDKLGATIAHQLRLGSSSSSGHGSGWDSAAATGAAAERGDQEGRRRLAAAIARFWSRVEAELPGVYTRFEAESLHVTLRGVIN